MFHYLAAATGFIAPIFIMLSPVLSYSDQAYSMYRNRSSAGFSLDIPLIMLVASMMRIFYYPGAHFDSALLVQSFLMIIIQIILLKVALDYRPMPSSTGGELPFAGLQAGGLSDFRRPYNFWQWRSQKPYWQFLLHLFIGLTVCELILAPIPYLYPMYSRTVGYGGLMVEATLPLPQMLANARSKSCKGFRFSVLVFWLAGDGTKMFWFFTSPTQIPWPFKLCGIFQAVCDMCLGVQYLMYGSGDGTAGSDLRSPMQTTGPGWPGSSKTGGSLMGNGRVASSGRPNPFGAFGEKDI